MDMKEFNHFQRDANATSLISLNTSYTESEEDNEFNELSVIENHKSQDPFLEIQKKDLHEFLMKGFSRYERLIFIL